MANKGSIGIDIKGFKEIYKNLNITEEQITKAAIKGMKITAQNILGESLKLVPIDSGTLQKSGNVKVNQDALTTTISYNTPYALKQHEDGSLDHSESIKKHEQGEAKYLERPFNEKKGELENNVGDAIFKTLEKNY